MLSYYGLRPTSSAGSRCARPAAYSGAARRKRGDLWGIASHLFQYSGLATGRRECFDGAVELRPCQCRGHLRPDARLPLGNHREGEPDDIDPELEQAIGHAPGERGIAQHHGNDGMLARLQVEAGPRHALTEVARIVEQ